MVELHVLRTESGELLTAEEWMDHDGAEYHCGGDGSLSAIYRRGRRVKGARLFRLPEPPLPLNKTRQLYFQGLKRAEDLAAVMGQPLERIQASLKKLRWLRLI